MAANICLLFSLSVLIVPLLSDVHIFMGQNFRLEFIDFPSMVCTLFLDVINGMRLFLDLVKFLNVFSSLWSVFRDAIFFAKEQGVLLVIDFLIIIAVQRLSILVLFAQQFPVNRILLWPLKGSTFPFLLFPFHFLGNSMFFVHRLDSPLVRVTLPFLRIL